MLFRRISSALDSTVNLRIAAANSNSIALPLTAQACSRECLYSAGSGILAIHLPIGGCLAAFNRSGAAVVTGGQFAHRC